MLTVNALYFTGLRMVGKILLSRFDDLAESLDCQIVIDGTDIRVWGFDSEHKRQLFARQLKDIATNVRIFHGEIHDGIRIDDESILEPATVVTAPKVTVPDGFAGVFTHPTLKETVIQYLRDEFEDDPNYATKDTSEIAEYMKVPVSELYDHENDTGVLFELMQCGHVYRYGPTPDSDDPWAWCAAGCRIEWEM